MEIYNYMSNFYFFQIYNYMSNFYFFPNFSCILNLKWIRPPPFNMPIGLYCVLKCFSFPSTLHLAYSYASYDNLFSPFHEVITEIDCTFL
jgi:hypothetical protein